MFIYLLFASYNMPGMRMKSMNLNITIFHLQNYFITSKLRPNFSRDYTVRKCYITVIVNILSLYDS